MILASVIFVGATITRWNTSTVVITLAGVAFAVTLALLEPAAQNDNIFYLIICGVVAMSSMLLPGLSGSFVLILMGNYQLIMLEAIPDGNLKIIAAVGIGAILGFVILSRIISFLLDNYKDNTIGGLTGFIFGSLFIIWPWKEEIFLAANSGELILKKGEPVVQGYDWYFPEMTSVTFLAISFAVLGFALVYLVEKLGATNKVV